MTRDFAKLFSTKWGQALVYTKNNSDDQPAVFIRMNILLPDDDEAEVEFGMSHPSKDEDVQIKFANDTLDSFNNTNIEDVLKKAFGSLLK